MQSVLTSDELYNMPVEYKFSEEEIQTIMEAEPKDNYKFLYGVWKQKRHNGLYLWAAIDQMPSCPRQSAFLRSSHIVGSRFLDDIEYREMIENYGRRNRRFVVWHYTDLETLIKDDYRYEVITPKEVVEQYTRLGFSRHKNNFNHGNFNEIQESLGLRKKTLA